jgi:hypothetical protein
MTPKERVAKVIEVLSAPESSDEIWWSIGELETLMKELEEASK